MIKNSLVLQFVVNLFVSEVVFLKMPTRQRKKKAKPSAKYLQTRDDVLKSARACYKAEHEKKRIAERIQKRNRSLNAKGIKQSQKRNGPLNAKGTNHRTANSYAFRRSLTHLQLLSLTPASHVHSHAYRLRLLTLQRSLCQ